jgi:tetratricopeptide (TPR) repeat protein
MGHALPATFPDEELSGVGIAYLQQNRLDEAESVFKKVLAMNPRNLQALKDLGDTYVKMADNRGDEALKQALDCYQQAVTARPDDIEARKESAIIKSRLNDHEGAIADFQDLLKLDPSSVDAMNGLGFECLVKKDEAGAIQWFDKAVAVDPKNQETWFNLGVADDGTGKYVASETAYRKALDQDSLSELSRKIRLNLGISLARRERWDEAIAVCQRLVDLYPDYRKAQNNLQLFKLKAAASQNPH